MKATVITCGFLSFSSLFALGSGIYSQPALAQCVQADIGIQYNIGNKPAQRSNDVQMESDPNCQGNRSVTTSVQGNVGEGEVQQNRRVRHRQRSDSPNPTGVQGPNVQNQTQVQVDVYDPNSKNPALELQNQRSK
jgi:hypothetical protein